MPSMPQNQTMIPDSEKQPKKQQGSGFTNLQTILNANKDSRLGTRLTGDVSGAAQKAQGTLGQQQQDFSQKLSSARTGIQQEKEGAQKVLGRFDLQNEQTPFQDTSGEEEKQFANLRAEQYGGPTGFADPNAVQQQAARAGALGQLAGSRGGRQELLRQTVGAGQQYTPTQQRLDEMILSLGGGDQALQKVGGQARKLEPQAQEAIRAATYGGRQAAGELESAKQGVASDIQNKNTSIDSAIKGQLEQLKARAGSGSEQANRFQQSLANGDYAGAVAAGQGILSPEDLNTIQAIGKFAQSGTTAGLANRFQAGQIPVSMGNAATDRQRAMENSLARLAGGEQQYLTPKDKESASTFHDIDQLNNQFTTDINRYAGNLAAKQAFNQATDAPINVSRGESLKSWPTNQIKYSYDQPGPYQAAYKAIANKYGIGSSDELARRYYTDPNVYNDLNNQATINGNGGPMTLQQVINNDSTQQQKYGQIYGREQGTDQSAIADFLKRYGALKLQ